MKRNIWVKNIYIFNKYFIISLILSHTSLNFMTYKFLQYYGRKLDDCYSLYACIYLFKTDQKVLNLLNYQCLITNFSDLWPDWTVALLNVYIPPLNMHIIDHQGKKNHGKKKNHSVIPILISKKMRLRNESWPFQDFS